jgi:hypothetical protein
VDPFFHFNAATIMMLVALGYHFAYLDDLSEVQILSLRPIISNT